MNENDLIIIPIADFEQYAPPDAVRAYLLAITEYIDAYHKVFSLPKAFAPNNQAIQRLLEASQRMTALEAEHSYRVGFKHGEKSWRNQ